MKNYVIITCGKRYVLKEKIKDGFFSAGLFASKDLNKVKSFAEEKSMHVSAIGDIYEV